MYRPNKRPFPRSHQVGSGHQTLIATLLASAVLLAITALGAGAAEPFDQTLSLQGVSFRVQTDNASSLNRLTITPTGLKIIDDRVHKTSEVFDLERDPFELRNLFDEEPARARPAVAELRSLWDVHVRRDPPGSLIDTDRANEFNAYRAFYGTSVPVPEPLWLEEDAKWLDYPFFIMQELPGLEAGPQAISMPP